MEARSRALIVILMGPAGAGKTTVGRALAADRGWPFLDADDFHSPEDIERMRRGVPLTDTDRAPWLARVHDAIARVAALHSHVVVACSALKETYRAQLARGFEDLRWVYLSAPPALLDQRLASRQGHFAGTAILDGQLKDLEPPAEALTIDATLPIAEIVNHIRAATA